MNPKPQGLTPFVCTTLGGFINKDPIEEQGGLNLYGFCGNNGVNRWDYLGMNVQYLDGNGSEYSDLGTYKGYSMGDRVNAFAQSGPIAGMIDSQTLDFAISTGNWEFAAAMVGVDYNSLPVVRQQRARDNAIAEFLAQAIANFSTPSEATPGQVDNSSNNTGTAPSGEASATINYRDPNPNYTNGALTFKTPLTSQHVSGTTVIPSMFDIGTRRLADNNSAGSFFVGNVVVKITDSTFSWDRPKNPTYTTRVTGVSVTMPTTVFYNTSVNYSNGASSLSTQFAENQHANDFWIARDSVIIPALNDLLSRPFNGLPADAERQIYNTIMQHLRATRDATIQRYDLPRGSAPHNGGNNPLPKNYPGFP